MTKLMNHGVMPTFTLRMHLSLCSLSGLQLAGLLPDAEQAVIAPREEVAVLRMNASNISTAAVIAFQNFAMILAFIKHGAEIRRKIISFW